MRNSSCSTGLAQFFPSASRPFLTLPILKRQKPRLPIGNSFKSVLCFLQGRQQQLLAVKNTTYVMTHTT
jgi:hypothetical protein